MPALHQSSSHSRPVPSFFFCNFLFQKKLEIQVRVRGGIWNRGGLVYWYTSTLSTGFTASELFWRCATRHICHFCATVSSRSISEARELQEDQENAMIKEQNKEKPSDVMTEVES